MARAASSDCCSPTSLRSGSLHPTNERGSAARASLAPWRSRISVPGGGAGSERNRVKRADHESCSISLDSIARPIGGGARSNELLPRLVVAVRSRWWPLVSAVDASVSSSMADSLTAWVSSARPLGRIRRDADVWQPLVVSACRRRSPGGTREFENRGAADVRCVCEREKRACVCE